MIEVRFHGRGGQGSVVASELLARAAFIDGQWPQSFPFFGVERRGAPVTAYTRLSDGPIALRTSITNPDIVVVLDPGLLEAVNVTDGIKPGGLLLANSRRSPEELPIPVPVRTATVDATAIAQSRGLGTKALPIVNTAILGALAGASGVVPLEAIDRAIDFVPARADANRGAAHDGFAGVLLGHGVVTPRAGTPAIPALELPDAPIAIRPSTTLRTSAWRTLRPVIHPERCTRCEFCWKFCPDDAIAIGPDGYPSIRLPYCKGCGICAAECPPGTIEMVPEEGSA